MAKLEKSPDFGVLQDFVDSLFADAEEQTRLDIVVQAESLDLNPDLLEIVRCFRQERMIATNCAISSTHRFLRTDGDITTEPFIKSGFSFGARGV